MESIIGRQKISRRRSSGSRQTNVERSSFGADRLGPRKFSGSPLNSARFPVSTKRPALPALDASGRLVEFRQKPAARKDRPFDRGPSRKRQEAATEGFRSRGRRASPPGASLLSSLFRVLGGAAALPKRAFLGLSLRARIIAAMAAIVLGLALTIAMILLNPAIPLPQGRLLPQDGANEDLLLAYVTPWMNPTAQGGDAKGQAGGAAALPVPPPILELKSYTIQKNDSLSSVAQRFGIAIDTLISMNGITNARNIQLGTELRVPNMNGLLYKVRPGDSLSSIAKLFGIDGTRIADANDLGSSVIKIGQRLFIPGARLPDAELKHIFGERVAWPVHGIITSPFGYRPDPFTGVRFFHAGIDIGVDLGTQVRAAMDGRVADAGYNPTFGNYVILGHADGIQSLYAHLSSYSVRIGEKVAQGTPIGLSGSTGYSTGPHLHFGLYLHGNPVNPLKYLK
jgi:murein DD-endopeptidase MepM/ murein hydrolase activator NlpD